MKPAKKRSGLRLLSRSGEGPLGARASPLAGAAELLLSPQASAEDSEQASLRESLGEARAIAELEIPSRADAAVIRLGGTASLAASEALLRELGSDPSELSGDTQLRLAVALSQHTHRPKVIRALGRLMSRSAPQSDRVTEQQAARARSTAALALAASGRSAARPALARALGRPGETSRIAQDAGWAHPPSPSSRHWTNWRISARLAPSDNWCVPEAMPSADVPQSP